MQKLGNIDIRWHPQQEELLKKWTEIATCYRWMYDRAYRQYTKKNMGFAIPVIILSTITGTANFAHESFPEEWQEIVPMAIGSLNLVAGLLTTIAQFLRVNELQEGHRVAGIGFAKFGRNIRVALNLPHKNINGDEFVEMMRQEYDRLLEQSPPIPTSILSAFQKEFKNTKIHKPEIIAISEVNVFREKEKPSWMEIKIQDVNDELQERACISNLSLCNKPDKPDKPLVPLDTFNITIESDDDDYI